MCEVAEWSRLGKGSYGAVWKAVVADRHTGARQAVAAKIIEITGASSDDVTTQDATDEVLLHELLATHCRAPSFSPLRGSFFYHEKRAGLALVALSDVSSGGSLAHFLACCAAPPPPLQQRHLLWQLLWSLTVAQQQLGFEHRDLSSRNIVVDRVSPAAAAHYTLLDADGAPRASWTAVSDLRLRLIDFGFSSLRVPMHGTFRGLAMHTAPEAMFSCLHLCDHRVDLFQLGIVAFSLFGAAHMTRREVAALATQGELLDTVRATTTSDSTLGDRFCNELLLCEPMLNVLFRDDATVARRCEWVTYVQRDDEGFLERYVTLGCLQDALGNGWRPRRNMAEYEQHSHFYRALHCGLSDFWWNVHVLPSALRRRVGKLVDALAPDERLLIKGLLAWHPAERLCGIELLFHGAFAEFRNAAVDAPTQHSFALQLGPPGDILAVTTALSQAQARIATQRQCIHATPSTLDEVKQTISTLLSSSSSSATSMI